MAKWEVVSGVSATYIRNAETRVLMCTQDEIAEIARKLNAFDEMVAILREAQPIIDSVGPNSLGERIDAILPEGGIPQAYPEGSPTIEEMKGMLDRKGGSDV